MTTQHDVIVAALNAVGALRSDCPVCGSDRWAAGKELHLLPVEAQPQDHPTEFRLGGPPLISASCEGCGYVRFFDAPTLLKKV